MLAKLNTTGKLKTAFLILVFILCLIKPIPKFENFAIFQILFGLVGGFIAGIFIAKSKSAIFKQKLIWPNWNDGFWNKQSPLSFFHFMAYFFIVNGIGLIIGTGFKYLTLQPRGVVVTLFGIGIWAGLKVSLKSQIKKSD